MSLLIPVLFYFNLKIKFPNLNKNLLWYLSSIILIIPIEESMRRSKLKKEPFSENLIQRKKRFDMFQNLIDENKWGFIIDGLQPIDEVWSNIRQKLE